MPLHNPLVLGQAVGSTTSLNSQTAPGTGNEYETETQNQRSGPLSPVPETGAGSETSPVDSLLFSHTRLTSTSDVPPPPPLAHTRTAPTTFPINPVAHLGGSGTGAMQPTAESDSSPSHASDTSTLYPGEIPSVVGGLHGQPMPGSKRVDGVVDEKDHQAGTIGGRSGPELAEKARNELGLGLGSGKPRGGKTRANTLDVEKYKLATHQGKGEKVLGENLDRTATGTRVNRHPKTGGYSPVQGLRMLPVTRQPSLPPAVGPWGGAAPDGVDADEGLMAVTSHFEELQRQKTMDQKGPDPYAVRFEPGEKENPKNWGVGYRWFLTSLAGLLVLNSTFSSSAPSGIVRELEAYFGFSQEVAILTISLFVAGYCVGPLLFGPLSESYGRRPIFILTFIVYIGFQIGCALSKNTGSILVFRFLGGVFASAPLTNSGALLADIWEGDHRGQAMSLFSLAPFAGPAFGPIVAGFISVTGTSWRWVFWVTTIFASVCFILIVFCVPETYAPALLVVKAKRLRKETGDDRYYAPLERVKRTFSSQIKNILFKPFIMLIQEPILLAITIYMSFVYGVVYLLFEAYPFIFVRNHGFNEGENGLAFLGFFLGGLASVVFFLVIIEPRYQRYAHKLAPQMPQPEKRLELCIVSGWLLVLGFLIQGWTAYPWVHWIAPIIGGSLVGFAALGMFVSLFNFIIDTYLWSAASALAAATVVRSIFGAGFPLFASQMYQRLDVQWASTLLAGLALLMAPIPIILTIYGPRLRANSKFSPNKM